MNNKRIYSSLALKYFERMLYQGITFVVQIILARILIPSDYGVLSIITVFVALSQVFVQSGFSTALVQNKDVTKEDYSSVLWVSILIAIVLYVILFFSAPWIAVFYEMPELSTVLRILALILIPGAYNSIQNAIISREMSFKQLVYCTTGAVIISGTIGIIMAYRGFGVWSLVVQQLSNSVIICVLLSFTAKWKIRFTINFKRIKILFAFGWKLLCANMIDRLYQEFQSLVIGKRYSSADLGYFNRGKQFPQLIVDNINGSIQTVMLPVFSREQDDPIRLKSMMRRAIVTSSYIVFPMVIGLFVVAEPLVRILLTDKWISCVPYLRVFCIVYAFYPIHTANLQAMNAQGKSDYYLKLEIIKKTIGMIALFITLVFFNTPLAISFGVAFVSIIACFLNAYPNRKLLNYSYFEQMKDIAPALLLSLIMGLTIYPLEFVISSIWLLLFAQVFCGCCIYIVLSEILKLECYIYIKTQLASVIKNIADKYYDRMVKRK